MREQFCVQYKHCLSVTSWYASRTEPIALQLLFLSNGWNARCITNLVPYLVYRTQAEHFSFSEGTEKYCYSSTCSSRTTTSLSSTIGSTTRLCSILATNG